MLKIVGDCNFADGYFDVGGGAGSSIKNGNNPFRFIKKETNEDFWIGNFECVCSDTSINKGLGSRQFIISPESCEHVDHLHFYGVANNHVMQHGSAAYFRMLEYLEGKGVLYAGLQTKPTAVFEHQGKTVSITAFSQRPENYTKPPLYWAMPEYEAVKYELKKCANYDYRIVYVHWGIEFINYPYNDQKQFAHFLIDCGADLVVGMHPHVMQGFEVFKDKYIFYSLGNCVFNMPWEPTKYYLQVNVELVTGNVGYRYMKIGNDFFPKYVETVPQKYSMEYLNSLLDICEDNELYFAKAKRFLNQYRKANKRYIFKNMGKLKFADLTSMITGYIKRRIG